MLIRKMENHDISIVCNLMYQLTGHEISENDMKNRLEYVNKSVIDEIYVYESDGLIHGVLAFRIRENIEEVSRFGEISVIVTNSISRRMGIGKALMNFAENLAKEKGCIGTWLVTDLDREEEAHKFYKELGYRVNGYRFVKPFDN